MYVVIDSAWLFVWLFLYFRIVTCLTKVSLKWSLPIFINYGFFHATLSSGATAQLVESSWPAQPMASYLYLMLLPSSLWDQDRSSAAPLHSHLSPQYGHRFVLFFSLVYVRNFILSHPLDLWACISLLNWCGSIYWGHRIITVQGLNSRIFLQVPCSSIQL